MGIVGYLSKKSQLMQLPLFKKNIHGIRSGENSINMYRKLI